MLANRQISIPGKRYRISSPQGAQVTHDASPDSAVTHSLPPDAVVVCAQALVLDNGAERVRISSPGGWVDARDIEPAAPLPPHGLDFETFKERHTQVAPGDYYGLDFPFTMDMFLEFGPAFLTQAFRAAGTIAPDNEVTGIVALESLGKKGASENAFLTVAYARPEPGLSEKLFAKFPPQGDVYKFNLSRMAQSEIAMHKFSREGTLPVQTAKYYFGEYSSHTTNYVLITDRIAFGVDPIEPAHTKGWDHQVPDVEEHYRVLARSLAALAAAHKRGALGHDIEERFPFARAARDFASVDDLAERVDRLVDFYSRVAPQLFSPLASDPAFMARWRADVIEGMENKNAILGYIHRDVDYVGFCHPNLNLDNAWFWREADGTLHAGLLDWGGAGQMSFAQALSGMLMMLQPEHHLETMRMVLATFIDELAAQGGPRLDPEELLVQYKVSLFSTAVNIILITIVDMLSVFSEEEYRSMQDRFDSRLMDSGFYAAIVWLDDLLREWDDELTPGEACRRVLAHCG